MSEFKFACPVCGQHITADSSTSGGQLECPTCFRRIVVPQAPASADSKFILSAAQVNEARPQSPGFGTETGLRHRKSPPLAGVITLIVLVFGAGTAAYLFRDKLLKLVSHQDAPPPAAPGKEAIAPPPVYHPIPTNISWTLNLTNVAIPNELATGSIHSNGFQLERAILQGGTLTLRQGRSGPLDFGMTVRLFAQSGEELSGKVLEVTPERTPPLPRVMLRWREEGQPKPSTENIGEGYAMRLAFGTVSNGRIPGRIYICLPDEYKSFVAGNFEAELRKPPPPKPKKPPKPGG